MRALHRRIAVPLLCLTLFATAISAAPPLEASPADDTPALQFHQLDEAPMADLIAGRDLYVANRVAFARGAVVPAGVFPESAVASLRANGGLLQAPREISAQAFLDEVTVFDHEPDATSAEGELQPINLHAMNAVDALKRIGEVRLVATLDQLHAVERVHPKYLGGRSTVLDAIEERRGELEIGTT